jgi:hypothetical protein
VSISTKNIEAESETNANKLTDAVFPARGHFLRLVYSQLWLVIRTAPAFFCMPAGARKAHATNERSANAPKTVGEYKASHGAGFGCCSTKPSRLVKQTRSGAKSFPTARPWMISH